MKYPEKFRGRPSAARPSEAGYMLLTLMLMAALVVIALAAVGPKLAQQIRRDHEEELIHRGVQYSRAIRKFYKKFGRYPVRLEELENTNNIRFLRKRYKDPITGNDFKLLHFGEVQMVFGPGVVGGVPPRAQGGMNVQAVITPVPTTSANQDQSNPTTDQKQNSPSSSSSSSLSPASASANSSPGTSVLSGSSAAGPVQVFGGSPIVGVASTSKKQSIREFNKKNHYDQWQFIYDPSTDRGGLLNAPAQPPLQSPAQGQNQPGQPTGQPTNPPGVPSLGGPAGQGGSPQPQMPPDQPPQ